MRRKIAQLHQIFLSLKSILENYGDNHYIFLCNMTNFYYVCKLNQT